MIWPTKNCALVRPMPLLSRGIIFPLSLLALLACLACLLACRPASRLADNIISLEDAHKEVVIASHFAACDWIRELVNAFVLEPERETKAKVRVSVRVSTVRVPHAHCHPRRCVRVCVGAYVCSDWTGPPLFFYFFFALAFSARGCFTMSPGHKRQESGERGGDGEMVSTELSWKMFQMLSLSPAVDLLLSLPLAPAAWPCFCLVVPRLTPLPPMLLLLLLLTLALSLVSRAVKNSDGTNTERGNTGCPHSRQATQVPRPAGCASIQENVGRMCQGSIDRSMLPPPFLWFLPPLSVVFTLLLACPPHRAPVPPRVRPPVHDQAPPVLPVSRTILQPLAPM